MWKCKKFSATYILRENKPNWRYTMWEFQDFSPIHILREINFGHFEAPKMAVLTIWGALHFEFLGTFDIFKCEIFFKTKIQSLKNCWNDSFWPSEISRNWFHVKLEWQKTPAILTPCIKKIFVFNSIDGNWFHVKSDLNFHAVFF